MSDYYISQIRPDDKPANRQLDLLLTSEGIRRDSNLDYTCGMYDGERDLIATGSCFGNTLRCMAVKSSRQGEGLMNQIMTHLMEIQVSRGNTHLFLYTKCSSARFFSDLGFYEIARIDGQVVFMENRKNGFSSYLQKLSGESGMVSSQEKCAALVMNANPFTLGHLYLTERAAAENDIVHLFIVSEDVSLIPFQVRRRLVTEGTSHLDNIIYHNSGPYIISSSTFPSYFQKDMDAVIESHARLDLAIFAKIAHVLGIGRRYVGEEPHSRVTCIYNQIMEKELPKAGIQCSVIPRMQRDGAAVSASTVRRAIQENHMELLPSLVPPATLGYLNSGEAAPVLRKIREAKDVIHY